jgi:hypothetical protein
MNSTPLQERITPRILSITFSRFDGKYYGPNYINNPCTNPRLQEVLLLYMAYC